MDEEPDWAGGDPEIAALLSFTPVPRGVVRADGWDAASQRGFIARLAATGNVIAAARAVERSESGAKQLRREDACGEFTAAWRGALALFRRRNPKPTPHGGSARPLWGRPGPEPEAAWGGPPPAEPSRAEADAHWQVFCDKILKTYLMKVQQEREARLAGCIVEADFYVRQLTWLEVALDLGSLGQKAVELMRSLKRGDLDSLDIVATPVSLLLDHCRRSLWVQFGEPERPPPPELGLDPGADAATGAPPECQGGVSPAEREAKERQQALQAEAQALWEAKARKDAAAWRERLGLPPLAEGKGEDEGDRAKEDGEA